MLSTGGAIEHAKAEHATATKATAAWLISESRRERDVQLRLNIHRHVAVVPIDAMRINLTASARASVRAAQACNTHVLV